MAYVIFDLDMTVIDSSHRHATLPDGSIDLAHWFQNATPEKIAADGLLPLARTMRTLYAAGHHIIICTARCMQAADRQFLVENNLPHHALLSRSWETLEPFVGDARPDADMKADLINEYFRNQGFRDAADAEPIMFDDNLKVVRRMIKMGVQALDAKKLNARMKPLAA